VLTARKEEEDKKNTIFAQRHKAANDAQNRKTIVAQGLGYIMRSKEDTKLLSGRLYSSKTFPILDDMAMSAAIESNSFTIYIGTTAQALEEEDTRFLTARGAHVTKAGHEVYTGQRNRAVLVNPDTGTAITMKPFLWSSATRVSGTPAQRNFARRRAPNANAAESAGPGATAPLPRNWRRARSKGN
jgi:hypothetical protein